MKNLISMTDFVENQRKNSNVSPFNDEQKEIDTAELYRIYNYANFLKQPLEPWMFVPCKLVDGVWVVLEYPDDAKDYIFRGESMRQEDLKEYQQAKERCLFDVECIDISNGIFKGLQFKAKSFKMVEYNITTKKFFYGCAVVEDLIDYNLELTETAIKQIGL